MNCKPGDLAVLIQGTNAGHICEVLSPWGTKNGRFVWNVRMVVTLPRFIGGDRSRPDSPGREGQCCDVNLRPISGVPVTDDVTDEVTA